MDKNLRWISVFDFVRMRSGVVMGRVYETLIWIKQTAGDLFKHTKHGNIMRSVLPPCLHVWRKERAQQKKLGKNVIIVQAFVRGRLAGAHFHPWPCCQKYWSWKFGELLYFLNSKIIYFVYVCANMPMPFFMLHKLFFFIPLAFNRVCWVLLANLAILVSQPSASIDVSGMSGTRRQTRSVSCRPSWKLCWRREISRTSCQ